MCEKEKRVNGMDAVLAMQGLPSFLSLETSHAPPPPFGLSVPACPSLSLRTTYDDVQGKARAPVRTAHHCPPQVVLSSLSTNT